ncbi:hypothetical protein [Legionella yabuuchiae]|uniref:hypothetical protein n=1 Tax=Legionella yabuuchiae TaxID=376727 RepID=UPI0010553BF8|nr:hypothetical protein [Legionella yabuuchiae]
MNTKKFVFVYVYGEPTLSILGFRSDTLNPHFIAEELEHRGWKLNLLQNPNGFHLCLTHVHVLTQGFEDKFIRDLTDSIHAVKAYPSNKKPTGNVKVYGLLPTMPTEVQKMVSTAYQKVRLFFRSNTPNVNESIQEQSNQLGTNGQTK